MNEKPENISDSMHQEYLGTPKSLFSDNYEGLDQDPENIADTHVDKMARIHPMIVEFFEKGHGRRDLIERYLAHKLESNEFDNFSQDFIDFVESKAEAIGKKTWKP